MQQEKTEGLSNVDIVVYALHQLGGWQRRVHTEDIALKCYEYAPSRFCWIKYPEYPDLSSVYYALGDAKKSKFGALVRGESEKKGRKRRTGIGGWMLTPGGIQWIEANGPRVEKFLGERIPTGERSAAGRKLKLLLRSPAFRKFMDRGAEAQISHAQFAEALVCTVNTRSEVLNDRLEQLQSIAEELGNEEVRNYVDFCRRRFAPLLQQGGRRNAQT